MTAPARDPAPGELPGADADPLAPWATAAGPYRTKVVEHIRLPSPREREEILRRAFYSVAYLDSTDVYIDLATDSGTGAMSDAQWAGLMRGDEAYIRSRSFFELERAVQEITRFRHVVPTHQGRAAENILMELLVKPGDVVPSNTLFDTTRAHVADKQGQPLDLVGDVLWDYEVEHPFKGDFDLDRLETALERYRDRVPFIIITVVNNMACSSPVSMANIRATRALADRYGIPVLFDACRFAENAFFIKAREPGYADKPLLDIVHEMFSYGHGCWMSAKKDAIVNIGGFIALGDERLARRCQERLVLYEGFPTYGGLARRDLEAMAVGLRECLDERHLEHRTHQVAYLGRLLAEAGVVASRPFGGSGVFVDVGSIYPHLPPDRLPGIALTSDLYRAGAVRVGAVPFELQRLDGRTREITPRLFQFARFAIPRRVYSNAHLEYVARAMALVKQRAPRSRGYRVTYQPEVLGHFFSRFEPLPA